MEYVIYYRVSTKGQGDSGLGLDAQKTYVEHFLESSNIVSSFTDVASGGIKERPELRKAVELCKEKGYTLAVAKIDRLSRVTEDALSIYAELEGRLFSCDIPNLDKFTLTLFMAIADRERELIKIRTKQALAAKKAKGEVLGTPSNFSAIGRMKGAKRMKAKADQNENNRRATRLVCSLRNSNMTYRAIADELNESGFKTAKGKTFKANTVRRLFNRYCQTA